MLITDSNEKREIKTDLWNKYFTLITTESQL